MSKKWFLALGVSVIGGVGYLLWKNKRKASVIYKVGDVLEIDSPDGAEFRVITGIVVGGGVITYTWEFAAYPAAWSRICGQSSFTSTQAEFDTYSDIIKKVGHIIDLGQCVVI